MNLSVGWTVYLYLFIHICLSVCLSACLSLSLSIYIYIYIYIYYHLSLYHLLSNYIICVDWCMCMSACMYACTPIFVYVKAKSTGFLSHSPRYFVRQDIWLDLIFTKSPRQGQECPGSLSLNLLSTKIINLYFHIQFLNLNSGNHACVTSSL